MRISRRRAVRSTCCPKSSHPEAASSPEAAGTGTCCVTISPGSSFDIRRIHNTRQGSQHIEPGYVRCCHSVVTMRRSADCAFQRSL
eukprot:352869-Chlamydomonas_euryale.AAC.3